GTLMRRMTGGVRGKKLKLPSRSPRRRATAFAPSRRKYTASTMSPSCRRSSPAPCAVVTVTVPVRRSPASARRSSRRDVRERSPAPAVGGDSGPEEGGAGGTAEADEGAAGIDDDEEAAAARSGDDEARSPEGAI